MKAQLGRPTGLALALLATLLATFLAMGVFSVAQAQTTPSATRTLSATSVLPGGEVMVTINVVGNHDSGVINETWPEEFSFVSVSTNIYSVDSIVRGNRIVVSNGTGQVPASFTYTLEAPQEPGGPYSFEGNFAGQVGGAEFSDDISDGQTVTVAAAPTNGGNGGDGSSIVLSSQEPGAAVQITINSSTATAIAPNQDIRVDLGAFSVPSTIADSAIDISSDGYDGNPSNVVVSGSNVTMTVPNVKANGDDQTENVVGSYSIRIKQSAGVTNAASGGSKTIEWQENYPDGAEKEADVSIDRVVKLSKTSGTRGTEITATFKGFANGSATVNLNGSKLAEVTIADNSGTLEIDTTSSSFEANRDNTITAQDAAGNSQTGDGAVFTVSPKAVVDPEESPVSKEVTITLSDWPANNEIKSVTIGARDVTPSSATSTDSDGDAEFKVTVPADANRGAQTVKVTGSESAAGADDAPSATLSLSVGVLALTIQPAMVVPGQQITIEGSGFVAGDQIDEVSIGNQTADVDATANSAGDVVIAVNVPSDEDRDGIGSGKKTVSVTADGSGRVAEGSIEIPKATIALDPETSRRGTTVNVSGSGFPSGDLVQVKYENNNNFVTVAAGSADASGAVSVDFVVPSYARIGAEHSIEATSVGIFKGVTAKATHETPGAMVSLSTDSTSSGQNITITGVNFPAFATVGVMNIGGVDVRPVPAPATSIDGDFESTVLVPQLELGNQTVSVRVSQTTITTFLTIGTATVSSAPADVFASVGDNLQVVWQYDNATSMWASYDPAAPAELNDLEEVGAGDIVWVEVTEDQEFQSQQLYAGWNLITLN